MGVVYVTANKIQDIYDWTRNHWRISRSKL